MHDNDLSERTERAEMEGPKTTRWIDRAEWLYRVTERLNAPEAVQALAFRALSHFVEAREHRRTYHRSTAPKAEWLRAAARENRAGVKDYNEAAGWLRKG